MQKQILIAAESYSQARRFANRQGWRGLEWSYISNVDQIRGLKDYTIHILPGTKEDTVLQAKVQRLTIEYYPTEY